MALWSPQRRLDRCTCTQSSQVSLSLLQAVKHRFIHGFIFTHTDSAGLWSSDSVRCFWAAFRWIIRTRQEVYLRWLICAPDVRSPFVNKALSNEARRTSHGLNSSSQVVDGDPWWALQEQRGAQLSWRRRWRSDLKKLNYTCTWKTELKMNQNKTTCPIMQLNRFTYP